MDTVFVEMQHPFAEEPAWSTLSPELSWSTLLLERLPNDTCQLTNISEKVRKDDLDGCRCERDPIASAKEPIRSKGYARRQNTKSSAPPILVCNLTPVRSPQPHSKAPQTMAQSKRVCRTKVRRRVKERLFAAAAAASPKRTV
jgi:hypothetical protein